MWRRLQIKDFHRPLRKSGAYDAVAAQSVIEAVNGLLKSRLKLTAEDAGAIQVARGVVLIETAHPAVSAEIRLQETGLISRLKEKGADVSGFRYRPRR